jgi:hypothetical protein
VRAPSRPPAPTERVVTCVTTRCGECGRGCERGLAGLVLPPSLSHAPLSPFTHTHTLPPPAAAPAPFAPPTVSDTKAAFYKAYRKPLPALYTPVVQELLVQHHLIKYNVAFAYDKVKREEGCLEKEKEREGWSGDRRARAEPKKQQKKNLKTRLKTHKKHHFPPFLT